MSDAEQRFKFEMQVKKHFPTYSTCKEEESGDYVSINTQRLYWIWESAQEELTRLQSEVERLSQYIIMNGDRIFSGDWACAQCHPNSDILVDGFECGFHFAQRLRQQAAAPDMGGEK